MFRFPVSYGPFRRLPSGRLDARFGLVHCSSLRVSLARRFRGSDLSGLCTLERNEDISGATLCLERRGPAFLQVRCVVADWQRVAVEDVDALPRLSLESASPMREVNGCWFRPRVHADGSCVEELAVLGADPIRKPLPLNDDRFPTASSAPLPSRSAAVPCSFAFVASAVCAPTRTSAVPGMAYCFGLPCPRAPPGRRRR